jgi:hypothetical protein
MIKHTLAAEVRRVADQGERVTEVLADAAFYEFWWALNVRR